MSTAAAVRRPVDASAAAMMVALCFIWGFTHVFSKLAAPDMSLVMQAGLRSIIAVALLLAWAHRRGIPVFERDGTLAAGLVAGGLFLREPARNGQPGAPAGIATAPANAAADDIEAGEIYAALDESPELYLWLASNDTESLALE